MPINTPRHTIDKLNQLANAQAAEAVALQQQIQSSQSGTRHRQPTAECELLRALGRWQCGRSAAPRQIRRMRSAPLAAQQQAEQQNLYLQLTATYGQSYVATADYAAKVAALIASAAGRGRGASRSRSNKPRSQRAVASQQQDISVAGRLITASSDAQWLPGRSGKRADSRAGCKPAGRDPEPIPAARSDLWRVLHRHRGTTRIRSRLWCRRSRPRPRCCSSRSTAPISNARSPASSRMSASPCAFRQRRRRSAVARGHKMRRHSRHLIAQAQAEQQNLYLSLTSTYGMAYAAIAGIRGQTDRAAKGAGRGALSAADPAGRRAEKPSHASISSLNQYALSLQAGSQSPLSPQAKLRPGAAPVRHPVGSRWRRRLHRGSELATVQLCLSDRRVGCLRERLD